MDSIAHTTSDRPRVASPHLAWLVARRGPIAASALTFGLVFYLALRGGGYDTIVRSEVGILLWWGIACAALAGICPRVSLGRLDWVAVGSILLLTVWTAVALLWTESAERTVVEAGRVATYFGVLVVALLVGSRSNLRFAVWGVATAIGAVGLIALLSRLQPEWFPANETARFQSVAETRLSFPLNYWNGLGTLMVFGVPLLLSAAVAARSAVLRAAAAGAVPVVMLTAFFTVSRGAAIELIIALVVFIAATPRRLRALPVLAVSALGGGMLVAAAEQRPLTQAILESPAADAQGESLLLIVALTVLGTALLVAAYWWLLGYHEAGRDASRSGTNPWSRSRRLLAAAAVAAGLVLAALAVDGVGRASDAWTEFKAPGVAADGVERFSSASGGGRWQLWSSAADAGESAPLTGIGPGTFEFWWAREGEPVGFVRDAHSLYVETFAELGMVGLLLLLAAFGALLAAASTRALRERDSAQRTVLSGALAAVAVFLVAAAVDWVWELAVLPCAFLLIAGVAIASGRRDRDDDRAASGSLNPRLALVGIAVAALVAIGSTLITTERVRSSQEASQSADLQAAISEARAADEIQPFAASPPLQEALVLEALADLPAAERAAQRAVDAEETNWRTWFVLARVRAQAGDAAGALDAYRQAKELNPNSPIFSQ